MLMEFAGKAPQLGEAVFIAPTAAVIGAVEVGAASNVWFGAVIRGDYGPIRIGAGCSIQDNAVVHVNHNDKGEIFPTVIDDDCVIGHGAVVEGCHIEAVCLVGMNAVILPRARIGTGSIVAAGAVVKEGDTIPPYSLLAGTPAKVKRQFSGPSPDVAWAAAEYRALAAKYLSAGG